MYQCAASNIQGTSYSNAQLRVLGQSHSHAAPSFTVVDMRSDSSIRVSV